MAFLGSVFSTNVTKQKPPQTVSLSGTKFIAPQLEDMSLIKDSSLINKIELINTDSTSSSFITTLSGARGNVIEFTDKWAITTEIANKKEFISTVTIEDITTINSQVVYDDIKKDVYLTDQSLAIATSEGCTIPGSDGIYISSLVEHAESINFFDKVSNFGKIYDFQFKQVSFGQYKFGNASLCTAIANAFGYLSFDKLLNDELILKKQQDKLHNECPEEYPAYSGFLVSSDYLEAGWIDIDQVVRTMYNDDNAYDPAVSMSVRTKRFTDAKRIAINFAANYTSSLVELNGSDKITDFGLRLKDKTNSQIFDYVSVKNDNLLGIGNQVILGYVGKINSASATTSDETVCIDACEQVLINKCTGEIVKVRNCGAASTPTEPGTSHNISPQFRINPLIESKKSKPESLNTIDAIHWTTGIQNIKAPFDFSYLKSKFGEAEYTVNALNQPRAFAVGGGSIDSGFVYGGFFHGPIREKSLVGIATTELEGKEGWGIIGNSTIEFTDNLPGSSVNSLAGSYAPCEFWNGQSWYIDSRSAPVGKAMGLGGGDQNYQVIGLGTSKANYSNNGVIKSIQASNTMYFGSPDVWVNSNINANISRVSPGGFLRSDIKDPSNLNGNVNGAATCDASVNAASILSIDANSARLGDSKMYMANQAQIELGSFFQSFKGTSNTGASFNRAVINSAVGFAFNGYSGCRGFNVDPFGFDKIFEADLSDTFEYVNRINTRVISETPSLTAGGIPTRGDHAFQTGVWTVDPSRKYPIKTIGTCYVGDECSGLATGGKSSISVYDSVGVNAFDNIKYGYFDDARYSEFNNSVLRLAYEYNGVTWVRRDNLVESVAFHSGVGDAKHSLFFGGLHASVEKIDVAVAFPGCEDWISTLESFGATWHRKGTTGLDREKRYAAFGTRYDDKFGNTYYKVGDFRDLFKSGIVVNPSLPDISLVRDISGVNTSLYITNPTSGHKSFVTYSNKNSDPSILDVTMFRNGESWVGNFIGFDELNGRNSIPPYSEREAALDDTDQVGFITKKLFSNSLEFNQNFKPDYNADPASSISPSAFPLSGYFADKNNILNIVGKYQYAGHTTTGGMWLWSRPSAGEELFHPEKIHDKPTYYTDSCGIAHISGNWESYNKWIDHSFKNHTGLHSVVWWANRKDCTDYQDQQVVGPLSETEDNIVTERHYRWTVGDFRPVARRLAPNGKVYACLSTDIPSDNLLIQYLGLADDLNGTGPTAFTKNSPISLSSLASLSGFSSVSNSPIDLFDKAWFVPTLYSAAASGGVLPVFYANDYYVNVSPDISGNYYSSTTISSTGSGTASISSDARSFSGGFFPLSANASGACDSWFNYSVNAAAISAFGLSNKMLTHSISGAGFFYKNNETASYLSSGGKSFYFNRFPTKDCVTGDLTWNFIVPDELVNTPVFDVLSFGLPENYIKPKNLTYSFYISREGQGLDQLFYGKVRNKFAERWKFPHTNTVLDVLEYNAETPYTIDNNGSGNHIALKDSNVFKTGTLSVGEFIYPELDELQIETGILNTSLIAAIKDMTNSQCITGSMDSVTGCDFSSLQTWINRTIVKTNTETKLVSYYPMTYDNFSGPSGVNKFFIAPGADLQHQFSILPSTNSSSIRDRAALWPWCDLIAGKATNISEVGKSTWMYDASGFIWTAETIAVETIYPGTCYDRTKSFDPLKRKITDLIIQENYPESFIRETYHIKRFDKKGTKLIDYKITYDNAAGPEITTGRTGFKYNIFGTGLKPRTINRAKYNNKPLAGPTQEWVSSDDENSSVMSFDWERTEMAGVSGVSKDAYPWNRGTVCEMISGGYNRFNLENPVGYFCKIKGEADVWIYSAPNSSTTDVIDISGNFFVDKTPFALTNVLIGSPNGMIPNASESYVCTVSAGQSYDCGYGMQIVRSTKYQGDTLGALVSTTHIIGPHAFGMGLYGYGKSEAYSKRLVWDGVRTSCTYNVSGAGQTPSLEIQNKAWPWNIIGFDGLLGPKGYTDAIDISGNYWLASGDINNTVPFKSDTSTIKTQQFKNQYTIIKVSANKLDSYLKTVLSGSNYTDYKRNFLPSECISNINLIDLNINGARYREAILETLNMPEGQAYFDIYAKIILENEPDVTTNVSVQSKSLFTGAVGTTLPMLPISSPLPTISQKLDIVSNFDIRCVDCSICDQDFTTASPSASPWIQHNHDEWISPFLDSPFAGPYNQPGFNIWLTVGGKPRWGSTVWATVNEGKVWISYRRQKLLVNSYRNHLVLSMITSSIAIENFGDIEAIRKEKGNSYAQVPVFVNYDEFIFCLDDYRNTSTVKKILSEETVTTANSYDCTDNLIALVPDNFDETAKQIFINAEDTCDGRSVIVDISGNVTLVTCVSGSGVYTSCLPGTEGVTACFNNPSNLATGIVYLPCYTTVDPISSGSTIIETVRLSCLNSNWHTFSTNLSGNYAIQYTGSGVWTRSAGSTYNLATQISGSSGIFTSIENPSVFYASQVAFHAALDGLTSPVFAHTGGALAIRYIDDLDFSDHQDTDGGCQFNLLRISSSTTCPTGNCNIVGISSNQNMCARSAWAIRSSPSETYTEWGTSFIQEFRKFASACDTTTDQKKYFFTYDIVKNYDSNTYITECLTTNIVKDYDFKRHQDGVGLGGDAPMFSGFTQKEYQCNRFNEWYVGQTAFGTVNKCIVVGGYAIQGNGELNKSNAIWENITVDTTFKWNVDVIQPEDTLNVNYKYRNLSPFFTNGTNSVSKTNLGVILYDVSAGSKVERQGSIKIESGKEAKVTFDDPIPDYVGDKYSIVITPNDNVKVWWEDKSTTGFTIKAETTMTGFVDWQIFSEAKIQGSVVDNIDDQDTFSKFENV